MRNDLPPQTWRRWALPVLMLALSAPLWLHRGEPALFVAIN